MQKLLSGISVALTTLSFSLLLVWLLNHPVKTNASTSAATAVSSLTVTQPQSVEPEIPNDFLLDDIQLESNEYLIKHESRKVYDQNLPQDSRWSEVEYVVVQSSGKTLRVFDAGITGMGQTGRFGLYPFLGKSSEQLFISQDTFRGGCQWIATLSPTFRVIFDGEKFGVGREGADLRAEDLDHDGISEIIVPTTGFYNFQDKMSISLIPLPEIIFKYDPTMEEYLPANPIFKSVLNTDSAVVGVASTENQLEYRSVMLRALTRLIYNGERDKAWQMFDQNYRLADKQEMKSRVIAILKRDPVYRFVYKTG